MVTPYYRDTEMTFLMHFLPGTPLEENGHDSIGVQSLFAFEPSDSVGLKFGLDFEFTDGYLRQTQDGGFGAFPAGKQYDFEVGGEMLSPYIIATFQATEANQISVGVRVEDLSYDYDNLMIDGNTNENGVPCAAVCRYARPADRSDSFTNSTAQVGWIHDVDSSSQLFANLAHAFRAPQATDLYRLQENQLVSDLDSEEIDSIEFGYRAGQQDVSFEVSAYYMKKKNEIFQDSSRRNVSDGRTKHRGIELNIVAALTDDVTVSAVTSFANHTYEADTERLALAGKDMDTAPKFVGNVQVDWDINDSNSLNFEWVHMGPYYEDELNEHRYAGHDLLNLRYRYDSRDDWYVAARLLNVLDTDYAERADWTTFQQDRYWVGEPASIYFTVGSSF
jgi:outer membrane receptor protein involved in Fe transport